MDIIEKPPVVNPFHKANIFSKMFYTWMFPLFKKGYYNDLGMDDLYDALPEDKSKVLGDKLDSKWTQQVNRRNAGKSARLWKALEVVFLGQYNRMVIAFSTFTLFQVGQVMVLRYFLNCFNDDTDFSQEYKYYFGAGIVAVSFGICLCFHGAAFYSYVIGMRLRIACSAVIYRKALRLSKSAQGKTTIGQLTNLLSNDVGKFDNNMYFAGFLLVALPLVVLLTYLLWIEFGYACLPGLGIILLLQPFQCFNGVYAAKCRLRISKWTDERGKVLNEIILGMRAIKQYAWEKPFAAVIHKLRQYEIKELRKRMYLRGFFLSLYLYTQKLVIFVTLLTYLTMYSSEGPPSADRIYFMSLCFYYICWTTLYLIPNCIAGMGEMWVSCKRIQKFLLLDERLEPTIPILGAPGLPPRIRLDTVSASWEGDKADLKNVSVDLQGDKIVVVVGGIGSGKSTLLHLLLGELNPLGGQSFIQGEIAYAAQESWVFGGNIRQNILFGKEMNDQRYRRSVRAAALTDDLKQWEFGDRTIVGERGDSLSGGQKARVNLARCLYQDAQIYLLDDPLSAVDSKVSQHLFDKCVTEYLRGKLRILVTHQLQYLPRADHIIVMSNGSIAAQGNYRDLVASGVDIIALMSQDEDDILSRKPSTDAPQIRDSQRILDVDIEPKKDEIDEIDLVLLEQKERERFETKETGAVNTGIFGEYIKSGKSAVLLVFFLFCFIVCQITITASEYFLSYWTSAETKNVVVNGSSDYLGRSFYVYMFGAMVASVVVFSVLRAFTFFGYLMRVSVNLHNRMFTSLVRSEMKFFDENPSGRIMNRFTKDLGCMDELLGPSFFDAAYIFANVAGIIVLVVISNFYTAISAILVVVALVAVQRYTIRTIRDIKRIEGISKSPMFTHTAATYHGLTTIRSCKAERILIDQFDKLQDFHTSTWFLYFSLGRGFGFWLEVVCLVFLAAVIATFLLIERYKLLPMDSAIIGLAVTSAISLASWLQWGMRQASETENYMTSVERILEYTNLKPEAPLESEKDKKPPEGWPEAGHIHFHRVTLTYGDRNVLRNLSFEILSQEKIGVVGRTGAGKSSVIQALFRMTEPQGDIFIDGIPIKDIGLHDLRKKISIIPQEPVLFSGSMRYNLDPFNEYSDAELWDALGEVELKDHIPGLDFHVADGGANFSLGQRQLVCMARAILRDNRIIVMDEVTANVDAQTDNLIQTTVRTNFADCTILTIAHRLNSVIDCNRILVLDKGTIAEYDHPHILLQNPDGILTAMVQHTGKSSAPKLRRIAQETYFRKRPSFSAASLVELAEICKEEDIQSIHNLMDFHGTGDAELPPHNDIG